MLPVSSVLVIALVLIAPVTIVVAIVNALLRMLKKEAHAMVISVFICAVYLLVVLRLPVFEISSVRIFFNLLGSTASIVGKIIYVAVLAALLAFVFRHNIRIFTVMLGAMTVAAFAMNITSATNNLTVNNKTYGSEMEKKLLNISLSKKPNIYFILSDGYSSFAYMDENGIDVSGFKSYLSGNGFRLYEEVFSNYHSTSNAMTAMLNMDHHYYALSRKFSEISRSGRVIVGGKNNLVNLLKRNAYQTQYIHHGTYLLLHGCSVDHCYPRVPFAGAKTILRQILPSSTRGEPDLGTRPLEEVQKEIVRLVDMDTVPKSPRFQYIHIYRPSHTPNKQEGICDQVEQVKRYAKRTAEVNNYLRPLIGNIISRDPTAVIVITGDHGPFISEKCGRNVDLDTLTDYRDRVGVLMAIRWPESYDGRYDDRIKTTVNMFRYVLASLTEDDTAILNTLVPDDVYIQGSVNILKVVGHGNILIPPEHYTKDALQKKHRRP